MVVYGVPKGTELKSVTYVADPDIEIGLDGMVVKAPPVKRVPKVGGTAKGGGLAFTVSSMTYPTSLTQRLVDDQPQIRRQARAAQGDGEEPGPHAVLQGGPPVGGHRGRQGHALGALQPQRPRASPTPSSSR